MTDFGHVVLSKSFGSWEAKYIAICTQSYFSHSFLTVPPICDRLLAMEATLGGVGMMPFDLGYENDPTEDFIQYELLLPAEIKEAAISSVMNSLQQSYGVLEYPFLIYRLICSKIGLDVKKQKNWTNRGVICSELVTDYLIACGLGYLFVDFGESACVTPQDLYEIVNKHPELFREVKRKIRAPEDKRLIA